MATFIQQREQPTGPVETFSTDRAAETVTTPIATEDIANVLLRYDGGARGVFSVSQISPGRKNSLQYEIDGSLAGLAWDSEQPDQLWTGRRDEPNNILIKNPALMNDAGRRVAALPGGHVEGFADTFAALFRTVYADIGEGSMSDAPVYATFRDGHEEALVGDAIAESSRSGAWTNVGSSNAFGGGTPLRLGFLTAPLPDMDLMDIADWAAASEFDSIEIAVWPR